MHIHILGICGTFMGGVAALARAAGHEVSGCDRNVYPPMSTQLKKLGIEIHEGYDADQFSPEPDCVVVGNAMSRGMPAVEAMLDGEDRKSVVLEKVRTRVTTGLTEGSPKWYELLNSQSMLNFVALTCTEPAGPDSVEAVVIEAAF